MDSNGKIDRNQNNPLIIRICKPSGVLPPHLHYRNPHPFPDYKQSQLNGLTLVDVDMFQFVNGIFRARSEHVEPHIAMGFTHE